MATTVFSGQSTAFKTRLEGSTIRMEGEVKFDKDGIIDMRGNMFKNEDNSSVGYYGMASLNLNSQSEMGVMIEAAQLLQQVMTDTEAKRVELFPEE